MLWILIPGLVFCFLNSMADRQDNWLKIVDRYATKQEIDAFFIGSSRVLAAIDPDAFIEEIQTETGKCPRVLKVSQGFTTLAEYYCFIRQIAVRWPGILKQCTVFIEAPMGFPSAATWNSAWVAPEFYFYIVPYLSFDVIQWMWHTKLPVSQKVLLTRMWFIKNIPIFAYQSGVRTEMLQGGTFWVLGILKKFAGDNATKAFPWTFDYEKKIAIKYAANDLKMQRPVGSWDRTVLADLVRLIRQHGGQTVFYRMPLSSVQTVIYETPVRRKDREHFCEWARIWGTPVLDNGIQVTDQDFPDSWHLSRSRAAEFSKDVARKFIQTDYFRNTYLEPFKGK